MTFFEIMGIFKVPGKPFLINHHIVIVIVVLETGRSHCLRCNNICILGLSAVCAYHGGISWRWMVNRSIEYFRGLGGNFAIIVLR